MAKAEAETKAKTEAEVKANADQLKIDRLEKENANLQHLQQVCRVFITFFSLSLLVDTSARAYFLCLLYHQKNSDLEEEKRNLEEQKKEKQKKNAAYQKETYKKLTTSTYVCTSTLPYPNPNIVTSIFFLIVIL